MKIAVTYENGQVFQHFGHTEQFKIYEAAEGKVVSARVVETGGSGHGALAGFLRGLGVDTPVRPAVRTPRWRPCWLAAWPTIPTPYAATTTTVRGIPADTITRAVTPAAAMTTAADITADWA